MASNLVAGIVGCGNISTTYLRLAPLFRGYEIRACADIDPAAAARRASEYGVEAMTVDGLLADPAIDIVINLTVPAVHYAVTKAALEAGKHVYSEKPFVLSVEEGLDLKRIADAAGLRVGSAPDTYLGGAHQLARALIDEGRVGRITGGTCHMMDHGMEHWHPNPDFFFQPGGGPMLDLGPYYVANLVQLLGPVRRVGAMTSIPSPRRTITSKPRHGETIPVATPTTIHALLQFASGAVVTLATSWDVWSHGHSPMELYGEEGSLGLADPNFFGGEVQVTARRERSVGPIEWDHPFGVANDQLDQGLLANYRGAGLADMALAIGEGRPHRCSLEASLHAIEIMTAILKSGKTGAFVDLATSCERPAALGPDEARALLNV